MSSHEFIVVVEWFYFLYFILLNGGYIFLTFVASSRLKDYMEARDITGLPQFYTELEPPVSILVPAYNEALNITAAVRSLLQLRYSEFEVIVINDGSCDETLDLLKKNFSLRPFPEAYRNRLPSRNIRAIYRSLSHGNLRVVDKENGGKADSLNAGINAARYPLFCGVDADSMLHPESLRLLTRPFMEDPRTVACGGTVRLANGCEVRSGVLVKTGLPHNILALLQIVEYLRAFLFGRLGWSPMNALLIISGAFGLFHKESVVRVGGYRTDTVGEDMELVVRLHRLLRQEKRPYRISFVPDPVCWTEAPEDMETLKNQRIRWQRGLGQSLAMNRGLLFARNGGMAGWFAFPFLWFFEWWGPLFELSGYAFMSWAYWAGFLGGEAFVAFLLVAVGLGVMLSTISLLLEERSFQTFPHASQLLVLLGVSLVESLGYRQLVSVIRLYALLQSVFRIPPQWGMMTRQGRTECAQGGSKAP
jgi:cellulose synthase/poly-beta-1,6-N-acetylglucosamine synthase-like glycosyltransferase